MQYDAGTPEKYLHSPEKHLRSLLLAAWLLLSCAACAGLSPRGPDDAQAALQSREEGFLSAMAAQDLDRVVDYFADDAVVHIADMPPLQGRSAIHRFYGNVFRFQTASASTPETLRMAGSADLAYSRGRVTNEFRGEDGPVEFEGKYVLVWQRQDDEWQVAAYSISSNQPDS